MHNNCNKEIIKCNSPCNGTSNFQVKINEAFAVKIDGLYNQLIPN